MCSVSGQSADLTRTKPMPKRWCKITLSSKRLATTCGIERATAAVYGLISRPFYGGGTDSFFEPRPLSEVYLLLEVALADDF